MVVLELTILSNEVHHHTQWCSRAPLSSTMALESTSWLPYRSWLPTTETPLHSVHSHTCDCMNRPVGPKQNYDHRTCIKIVVVIQTNKRLNFDKGLYIMQIRDLTNLHYTKHDLYICYNMLYFVSCIQIRIIHQMIDLFKYSLLYQPFC